MVLYFPLAVIPLGRVAVNALILHFLDYIDQIPLLQLGYSALFDLFAGASCEAPLV